ncbi:type IV pili methyl-accepting chemotaxis transducer N-terminal domain-containing protein [Yoonia litorea]|uniref:Type IV pili methyl-accepting chemotaxis transducer N-term n=1 Tax=Yoonia litorea TaxID=1123755 RepID=A0A1I6N1D6_9RHOB|nr:type IV pili methyl-accepting chemotaxis transducer N-terminal domain-containing protein [Yoonia litorea]SFS21681.1 Type IV pili methyl-accepting chemotaxis transducer N-term [Yoonia litorea]
MFKSMPFGRCANLLGAVVVSTFATAALAEDAAQPVPDMQLAAANMLEDDGASERINQSGKLRMLSQQVVAAGCYVRAGVDTSATWPTLINASKEFNDILYALEFGDPSRGIFDPEERRRTLVGLTMLNEHWGPVEEQARLISVGAGDATTVAELAALSVPLLEFAQRMTAEITAQYSNPAVLVQADALLIDIAGRQRMLSQRISKNACLTGTGLGSETVSAELQAASELFENSLYALANGMSAAGVRPPPTEEIADALAGVTARWEALKPILASIEQADSETLAIVFAQTSAMTAEMNSIVGLYSDASKTGI